jgi:SHS2 domain-containing protein
VRPGYEILEHTADVGIRAWGPSLAATFEQAAWGLAEILGARAGVPIEWHTSFEVTAVDREALLVAFLNELILLHESEEVAFVDIGFSRFTDTVLRAEVSCGLLPGEAESTGVKAATYHGLQVRETDDGYEVRVYLDV